MAGSDSFKAIFASAFDQQKKFIKDKSRRKALFVPRRGAKTYAIAIYMVLACLSNESVKILYLGLTRDSAENAVWRDCLLKIFKEFDFVEGRDYEYNRSTKTIEFLETHSTIRITGADSSFKEPTKYLGGKYYMAVIDECQNYTNDLEEIILKVLGPAVSDYIPTGGGQIVLAGTAGPYMGKHYWFQINTDKSLGWNIHTWEGKDNPHMRLAKEIEEADFTKQYGPAYVETEWYRQQYLCQWITDTIARVYHYSSTNCKLIDQKLIDAILDGHLPGWEYILGIDLGHNDAFAMCLLASHPTDPNLYVVKSEKFSQTNDLEQAGQMIVNYSKRYNVIYYPIDSAGSGKMIVEDWRRRYALPFEYPKSKSDKHDFIRQMNSDFTCSKIKVIEELNKDLLEEWNTVLLDKHALDEGYRKEADKYHNDLCDAALYGFSQARHYWAKTPKPKFVMPKNEQERREQLTAQLVKRNKPQGLFSDFYNNR